MGLERDCGFGAIVVGFLPHPGTVDQSIIMQRSREWALELDLPSWGPWLPFLASVSSCITKWYLPQGMVVRSEQVDSYQHLEGCPVFSQHTRQHCHCHCCC